MIIKEKGSIFEIEGKVLIVGGVVEANTKTDYSGRKGIIIGVRTGEDKDTDNLEDDIYVKIGDDEVKIDRSMVEPLTN